jgi:hypothetical protein
MGVDPFADASNDFITPETLLGRLLLVKPTGVEQGIASTMPGQEGKTYDRVIADVTVLDGPISDKLTEIPCVIEGTFLSGSGLVSQLTKRTGGGNLAPGRLTLGRMANKAGRMSPKSAPRHSLTDRIPNGFWSLDAPTDAEKQTARDYLNSVDPFAEA